MVLCKLPPLPVKHLAHSQEIPFLFQCFSSSKHDYYSNQWSLSLGDSPGTSIFLSSRPYCHCHLLLKKVSSGITHRTTEWLGTHFEDNTAWLRERHLFSHRLKLWILEVISFHTFIHGPSQKRIQILVPTPLSVQTVNNSSLDTGHFPLCHSLNFGSFLCSCPCGLLEGSPLHTLWTHLACTRHIHLQPSFKKIWLGHLSLLSVSPEANIREKLYGIHSGSSSSSSSLPLPALQSVLPSAAKIFLQKLRTILNLAYS